MSLLFKRITRPIGPVSLSLLVLTWFVLTAGCGGSKENPKPGKQEKAKTDVKKGGGQLDKWGEAQFKQLMNLTVDGFDSVPGGRASKGQATFYLQGKEKNQQGRYPFVMITVANCFGCGMQPMEKTAWEKKKDNLMMMLPKIHKENPALVFEIDELDIDGTRVITIFNLSFVKQESGAAASSGLNLHYNNGKRMVTLMISSRKKPFSMAKSLDELKQQYSKAEYIAVARQIFKVLGPKI